MRAKLVNEKFAEDETDPIKDMGIGVTAPHTFKTEDEFIDYLIDLIIPYIYGGEIPKNILEYNINDEGNIIPNTLYININNFLEKYKYPKLSFKIGWPRAIKNKLIELGYEPVFLY